MNINFEYYKIFYHVAKASSISAAARELCISQPAVSQAIKALEQAIGIELFIRTKKGVSLTNAGELLYSHVAAGYESISLGEQQLSQLLHMETGEIRIGASDMTLQFYLLPYLEHFHQLYPGIKVHVTNAPTPSTINHLLSGNIDFGIVTSLQILTWRSGRQGRSRTSSSPDQGSHIFRAKLWITTSLTSFRSFVWSMTQAHAHMSTHF